MKHEKIIKREDGTSYLITVVILVSSHDIKWMMTLSKKEKGKRKFIGVFVPSYEYSSLKMAEREKYRLEQYLSHVTAEEIFAAKTELWEKLRPTL